MMNPPAGQAVPMLEARGIAKRYGSVTALEGVDFEVYAGEICALIGDNGAGKSTLIKILSGVERPDAGTIRMRGNAIEFHNPREARAAGIETVYQDLALAPDLIIGYARGYRASWATCLGDLTDEIHLPNDSAWSADHCADALEVPGVLFSNRPIRRQAPSLVDLAPTILGEFDLAAPPAMVGKNIFTA